MTLEQTFVHLLRKELSAVLIDDSIIKQVAQKLASLAAALVLDQDTVRAITVRPIGGDDGIDRARAESIVDIIARRMCWRE